MSFTTFTSAARALPALHLSRLAGDALHAVRLMLARSRERQVLATLDARTLRDIGVTAFEAGIEARKPFWRV
ncbi:DUF1127 domain-containing protein [Roseomonas sp. HJA6]|uniref:DUF1127 domain-containing protein n=1 Tax=Roseomonas alba TaxID=2846776 RepID=A0ABS7A9U0_9PROT|nr:DUF1127 domain-containing protein [Neoroseomonas alba]MBW6398865.1 DUF1127 domain-containing protein [Neoroseomonas alba]